MFGYVRPYKDEMKVREYEQYKGIYCGLCRALGKEYGVFTRLTLSYDCTFFAAAAIGRLPECPEFVRRRCVVNPAKKCWFCTTGAESVYKYAAALSVLLTWYKLCDTVQDEGFLKRMGARAGKLFFGRPFRRAARDFPELAETIRTQMEKQAAVEREENPSLDACCEPTAEILGFVFSSLGKDDTERFVLHDFGYALGRWIYTADAADDLEDDLKEGAFNPLIGRLGLKGCTSLSEEQRKTADAESNACLNLNAARIGAAMNLIDFGRFAPLIDNVVRLGLPRMQYELFTLHLRPSGKHDAV